MENRQQRRAREARGRAERVDPLDGKCTMTFHTPPSTLDPAHVALLMTTMERVFTVGSTLPGVTFPVHVAVEYGGKKACGTVQPAGTTGAEMAVDPSVVH